jgi:hypothetical protein
MGKLEGGALPEGATRLLRDIVNAVKSGATEFPCWAYLAHNQEAMKSFLLAFHHVLREKGPDGRRHLFDSQDTFRAFMREAIAEWLTRSPEIDRASIGLECDSSDPKQKLRYFAAHISTLAGGANPMKFVTALDTMMKSNEGRVQEWADSINSAQGMLEKFQSWVGRGLISLEDFKDERNILSGV